MSNEIRENYLIDDEQGYYIGILSSGGDLKERIKGMFKSHFNTQEVEIKSILKEEVIIISTKINGENGFFYGTQLEVY